MSTITKRDPREHEIMEARFTADSVFYVEKTITTASYRCNGCGLVWAIRWHAEKCEARGHVPSFLQHYGGGVVNGRYRPAATYERRALNREQIDADTAEEEVE